LPDQPIGRRARRAALAGEELENRARFPGPRRHHTCNHKARNQKRRRDTASLHYNLRLTALVTVDDRAF
jgi:hypothetical protein